MTFDPATPDRTDISSDDIPRASAVIRLAGELLEAHGALTLELTRSWSRGIRSANLEPHRSDRYEEVTFPEGETVVRVPAGDPTGEAVLTIDPTDGYHREFQTIVRRMTADAGRLRDLIGSVVPPVDHVVAIDDWCSNHLRIQVCEPRHRGDLCRFCYDFHALRRALPPPSLLGIRHRYGRVTQSQIDDALTNEKKKNDTVDKVGKAVRAGRRKAS